MKNFGVIPYSEKSVTGAGQGGEFYEEFYGWEKTTNLEDRQMKFGDLSICLPEGNEQKSGTASR